MSGQITIIFLLAVALGSYVQTVTGFAMGLIIMGITASLQLAPISFIAAVISLTALVNVILAVYKDHHHIHWKSIRIIALGFFPAMVGGLFLLYFLDKHSTQLLQLILGIVIMLGGILLMLKPHPHSTLSPSPITFLAGMAAGIMGGLFSTGAPPLVYYLYRQPLSIKEIRSTLLTAFMMATIGRITFLSSQGHLSHDILTISLYSLPVVIFFTWLGKTYPPTLSDINMRRAAFGLLILLGLSTAWTALLR